MSIFSRELLYSAQNIGFWEKITKLSYNRDAHNISYNSYYECYTMYGYSCDLYYSKDLVNWKSIYGDFIYNPKNQHYYKVEGEHEGNNLVVYISEMTSIDNFGTKTKIDSIAYNTYTFLNIYNAVLIGGYYAFPYSLSSSIGNGASAKNNAYQRVAYTQDFKTWKITTIFSETNVSYGHTQITNLGSSGSKFVIFSSLPAGYCPVTFTSPTKYTKQAALWTSGNMTAATGFYCNGNWHYCEWGNYTTYISSNGTNFNKCSSGYWRNPYMIFYQNQYISSNSSTGELRVYDSNFSEYKEIEIPCNKIQRVLGILDNYLYVLGSDSYIYRTNIENLFN